MLRTTRNEAEVQNNRREENSRKFKETKEREIFPFIWIFLRKRRVVQTCKLSILILFTSSPCAREAHLCKSSICRDKSTKIKRLVATNSELRNSRHLEKQRGVSHWRDYRSRRENATFRACSLPLPRR